MVNQLSSPSYRFIEKNGHIDLVAKDTKLRFTVKGAQLSPKIIEKAIVELIQNKTINIKNEGKQIVRLSKIAGIRSDVVLEVASIKLFSILQSATRLFQSFVGFFLGKNSPLTKQVTAEFRKALELLPLKTQKKIEKSLHITPEEHYLMEYLGNRIDFSGYTPQKKLELLLEMLNGAYVIIDDGGETYKKWVDDIEKKKLRFSSHQASAPQYAVRGPLFKECLFSKRKIVENGVEREVSWVQLERYEVSLLYGALHLISWAIYKVTGRNQGPTGESLHTEKRDPIILKLKQPD